MKTADGMVRSTEHMRNKKAVLHHLEVHPHMGGGVRVEHHHTEPGIHPPKVHHFGPDDGTKFHDHMEEHTGMSWSDGSHEGNEVDKEGVVQE